MFEAMYNTEPRIQELKPQREAQSNPEKRELQAMDSMMIEAKMTKPSGVI